MNEEVRRLDRLIDTGAGLNEIERRLDTAPLDEEAKAAVWLRAYSARPGFRRSGTVEQIWRHNRVASG